MCFLCNAKADVGSSSLLDLVFVMLLQKLQ